MTGRSRWLLKKVFTERGLIFAFAAVWALLVGALMAGAAAFFGFAASDAILIGILGGLGAAASVIFLAGGR